LLAAYYSNFLMGLSASALAAHSMLMAEGKVNNLTNAILAGIMTLVFYNLHYAAGALFGAHSVQRNTPRMVFLKDYWWPIGLLTAIAGGVSVVFIWRNFTPVQWRIMGITALISVLYSLKANMPTSWLKNRWAKWLKLAVLAGTWTAITTWLWLPLDTGSVQWNATLAGRLLLMIAICMPFDVRDSYSDREKLGDTLFDQLGLRAVMQLSLAALVLSWGLTGIALFSSQSGAMGYLFTSVAYLLTGYLIVACFRKPKKLWPFLWLDVHLVVYPLSLWLSR
jgi:hypothetical protein